MTPEKLVALGIMGLCVCNAILTHVVYLQSKINAKRIKKLEEKQK